MDKIKALIEKLKTDAKLRNKVIICGAAVLAVLVLVLVICLCTGGNTDDPSGNTTGSTGSTGTTGEIEYTVTVQDASGTPYGTDVVVNFLSGGNVVAMQTLNGNGSAVKALPAGDYTVELSFMNEGAAYYYDTTAVTLTAEDPNLTIVLSLAAGGETKDIFAYSTAEGQNKDFDAYYVSVGSTFLKLDSTDRNYYIFTPTESGLYRFSAAGSEVTLGYYGSTYFVQQDSLCENAEDGSFTYSVSPSMISEEGSIAALVIGIDPNGADSCNLNIERIGNHVKTIEDYPWDIYQATAMLSKYELPDQVNLIDFDITAKTDAYTLVFNSDDGFYHLDAADGPLVYMKLDVATSYLDSIKTILESSGISRYFFDENGEFLSKQSYTECLLEYIQSMDEDDGIYPLTKDLEFIIQQRGEYVGWWDSESPSFLFVDENSNPVVGLNTDIAWLFLCCYGEEEIADEPVDEPVKNPDNGSSGTTSGGSSGSTGGNTSSGSTSGSTGGNSSSGGSTSGGTSSGGDKEDTFQIGTQSSEDTVEVYYYEIQENMQFEATVKAGEYAAYDLWKMKNMVLTIESKDAYLIYDGDVYLPDSDGVLSFTLKYTSNYYPCSVFIGNASDKDITFTVLLKTPVGDYMNPEKLSIGSFTTKLSKGDEDGYWYTYTAEADGVFSITLDSVTSNYACNIILTNSNVTATTSSSLDEDDDNVVSIEVKKGDVIRISIGITADGIPKATVKATAAFKKS